MSPDSIVARVRSAFWGDREQNVATEHRVSASPCGRGLPVLARQLTSRLLTDSLQVSSRLLVDLGKEVPVAVIGERDGTQGALRGKSREPSITLDCDVPSAEDTEGAVADRSDAERPQPGADYEADARCADQAFWLGARGNTCLEDRRRGSSSRVVSTIGL